MSRTCINSRITFPASAFLLLLGLVCGAGEDIPLPGLENVPKVVAEVDGKPIYRNDLIREVVGSSSERVLNLIRRKLIEQAARALNIAITDEQIEQQFTADKVELMAEMIRMPWDKKYKEFPIAEIIDARFGMTVDEYKKKIVRERLLIRKCVARDLNPKDRELLQFFKDYPDLFQQPPRFHAAHILISPIDPRDKHVGYTKKSRYAQLETLEKQRKQRLNLLRDHNIEIDEITDPALREFARKNGIEPGNANLQAEIDPAWRRSQQLAETVLLKIRAGDMSWDQALRTHTQDPLDRPQIDRETNRKLPAERERLKILPGDVGWFHKRGPLVEEFYKGAKDLKPGEIGGPIRTPYGYHLVKMLEIQQQQPATFEEVRAKVESLYIENEIQVRSEPWMRELLENSNLQPMKSQLWPPRPPENFIAGPGVPQPRENANDDPVVGTVNGEPIKRSEIWRELIQSDGEESLKRLINLEMIMGVLKNQGVRALEWRIANPAGRSPVPPAPEPVKISPDKIDIGMNDDRIQHDDLNKKRKDDGLPPIAFSKFIYDRYGRSVEEYRRSIESTLVLLIAIRQKITVDEGTLRLQFALARDLYSEPEWFKVSHILVVPSGGMARADQTAHLGARTIADEVYHRYAADPTTFAALVRDFSDDAASRTSGGLLGVCRPDRPNTSIPDELYAELTKQRLKAGMASTPIRSSRGYHIVRVDEYHPGRPALFQEAREQVEHDYLMERAKMYTDLWLNARGVVKYHMFAPPKPADADVPEDNFVVPR